MVKDLEQTFREVTDPGYAEPLERLDEGLGWDPVAAAARILERARSAILANTSAVYLLPHAAQQGEPASGARYAEGSVRVRRPEAAAAVTLPAGTLLVARRRDSLGAVQEDPGSYALAEPLELAPGALEASVRVRALRPGPAFDVPAGTLVALVLEEGATAAQQALVVASSGPLRGGRLAGLDAIGRERASPRVLREPDLEYAYRLSALPDVVSPRAIERLCAQILSPLGVTFALRETQIALTGPILDRTPLDVGDAAAVDGTPWLEAALLTEGTSRRFFAIVVDPVLDLAPMGRPLDSLTAGLNAYDVGDAPGDGEPLGYRTALATLYRAIEGAREGGVPWRLLERSLPPVPATFVTLELRLGDPEAHELDVRAALAALYEGLGVDQPVTTAAVHAAIAGVTHEYVLDGVSAEAPLPGGRLVLGEVYVDLLEIGGGGGGGGA